MIEFHSVSLADREWIVERLKHRKDASCEYCFGNIYSYSKKMGIFVADCENCLVVKCVIGNHISYAYPVGDGNVINALKEIEADARKSGKKCYVYAMTKDDASVFENTFSEKYKAEQNRDAFDYVYKSEDLITLSGKKFQPKRNHISYFKRNFNWNYEHITKDNMTDCLEMSRKWLQQSNSEYKEDLEEELKIIRCVFENYDELGYVGGLIRVDGEVVAYTMGEELSKDMFCVHFEKAFSDIRGAYPIINQQFVQNELSLYTYINREDDVGAENLRKAKLSYNPVFLVEKYEAQIV